MVKFPCIIRDEVCNTIANIQIFSQDLDDDGAPVTIFSGTVKGNFQQNIKEVINGNTRTQEKSGTYLVPADYIPDDDYDYCGGKMTVGTREYFITNISPCYDLYGVLNYWKIITK